ncbi:MAG: hypothetical protein K6G76_02365 [Lachnospiraceae bacterium]|nr:hypothetical protein [Lachnospiraceae bacterium]
MSTGISISSINQIKELAEQKKYAEALEILDTQDLDKSINPQFLRISGEIFRENKRYFDSWRTLLRSHEMAPQGTRILADIIMLHLELGYFSRAKKYYEQYLFYSTDDDITKDYVEYTYKKATGTDIKELASILIPILENMPDDKWNFEAVLLYDKLDRKDKALEESQYILENFKESDYIKPVIEYIDDKLDVDEYFYVFPREEVPENKELYGELIEKEDSLLEADHLRMYPPEAKIMVEADDADAMDVKPIKEKKQKNKKASKKKNKKNTPEDTQEILPENKEEEVSVETEKPEVDEEAVKKEREAALDKLLSRKVDKESIRESAKQVAKNVSIDAEKAKKQVKNVTDSVIDNVKKATDTIGDAVGTAKATEKSSDLNEEFVDGIIESVLEPPKRAVGEVVTNEELDALIPDSLEAMSAEEVQEIEAKKEEQERIELEALEASLKLQEKKEEPVEEEAEEEIIDNQTEKETIASVSFNELKAKYLADINDEKDEEEKPLESLGFISVVQSDVDDMMELDTPEAAEILHRMIDNKEFYTGENSRGFESASSYNNHGFEVDDYTFNEYIESLNADDVVADIQDTEYSVKDIFAKESVLDFDDIAPDVDSVTPSGEMIQESILHKYEEVAETETPVAVEEVAETEAPVTVEEAAETEAPVTVEEVAETETPVAVEEVAETETPVTVEEVAETEAPVVAEEVDNFEHAEDVQEDSFYQDSIWKSETSSYDNDDVEGCGYSSDFTDDVPEEESAIDILSNRDLLRVRIILTDYMVKGLLDLKESR